MAPLAACRLQSLRSDWCVLGKEGGVCVGGGCLRDEIQQHLPTRTDTDRSQPPLPHRFAAASRAGFFDVDVDVGGLQLFDVTTHGQLRGSATRTVHLNGVDASMRFWYARHASYVGFHRVYILCVTIRH